MSVIIMVLGWIISTATTGSGGSDMQAFHISGYAQGTTYSIKYYANKKLINKKAIERLFSMLDSSLSVYRPYSLISRFNSGSEILMDKHLQKVIRASLKVNRKTDGAFDITVQPLVEAWGFGVTPVKQVPDSAAVRSMLKCVGMDHLKISGKRLMKRSPCVKIDVNGIGQGYSVDVVAKYLESKNIVNYLVEIGGEVRLKGRKQPENRPMVIGIEGPGNESSNSFPVRRSIHPPSGAVTTSGHYRKFYMKGNNKISHLIDAKAGYPIRNGTISVTVWAPAAMTADAYDNALIGMGVKEGLAFAEAQNELEAYFIFESSTGHVKDTATTGFYKMFSPDTL